MFTNFIKMIQLKSYQRQRNTHGNIIIIFKRISQKASPSRVHTSKTSPVLLEIVEGKCIFLSTEGYVTTSKMFVTDTEWTDGQQTDRRAFRNNDVVWIKNESMMTIDFPEMLKHMMCGYSVAVIYALLVI